MYKFAHIADCHLGAQKDPELKKLELRAFRECLNKCVEEKVDFIIIAGDLFHSNIPDMRIVKEAVSLLKEVNDSGISVYVNYGSHDFSPNETSIIDIITETGLLKKLFIPEVIEDEDGNEQLELKFTIDKKTNAKLIGISGRKIGIEEHFFKILDRENLENEEGFKIFVFHSAVEGMIPSYLSKMDFIKRSYFPKGFDYYAGGHIHKKVQINPEGYGPMVYPGPLFAGYPRDLEISSKGEKRGFYIIEFDERLKNCSFYELNIVQYYNFHTFSADHKTSDELYSEILKFISQSNVQGKIVIMKVKGELSSGKTSDINFNEIRRILKENGAIYININHHSLISKEFSGIPFKGETNEEIEKNILRDNISNIDVKTKTLIDEQGAKLAEELIKVIRQPQKPNEKKLDYNDRILTNSLEILDLEGNLDET